MQMYFCSFFYNVRLPGQWLPSDTWSRIASMLKQQNVNDLLSQSIKVINCFSCFFLYHANKVFGYILPHPYKSIWKNKHSQSQYLLERPPSTFFGFCFYFYSCIFIFFISNSSCPYPGNKCFCWSLSLTYNNPTLHGHRQILAET